MAYIHVQQNARRSTGGTAPRKQPCPPSNTGAWWYEEELFSTRHTVINMRMDSFKDGNTARTCYVFICKQQDGK